MNTLKKAVVLLSMVLFIAVPVVSFTAGNSPVAAANSASDCEKPLLNIHPWFRGLAVKDTNGKCIIAGPGQDLNGKTLDLAGFIWRIALNVVDIGLAIVGYIAFFFILYGGFQFLTGGSNSSQIEQARKTILNAVVGLVISFGATAIINLVFGIFG